MYCLDAPEILVSAFRNKTSLLMAFSSRKVKSLALCGGCTEVCDGNDIRCDFCRKHYHISCEDIPYECLSALSIASNSYRCISCLEKKVGFQYSYKQGLARLNKAQANGFKYLKMCVNQEAKFVPQNSYQVQNLVTDSLEVDTISLKILQQCGLDNVVPYQVESRHIGSCLFDSVSALLNGDESLSTELRVKTCIEMVQNQDLYENHQNVRSFMVCSPVFEKACFDCASSRGWSSVWTMLALPNVIRKNINSIYPPMNGKNDRVYSALDFLIESRVPSDETLNIMWTRQSAHKKGTWTPDHFVPVLAKKICNFQMENAQDKEIEKKEYKGRMDEKGKKEEHRYAEKDENEKRKHEENSHAKEVEDKDDEQDGIHLRKENAYESDDFLETCRDVVSTPKKREWKGDDDGSDILRYSNSTPRREKIISKKKRKGLESTDVNKGKKKCSTASKDEDEKVITVKKRKKKDQSATAKNRFKDEDDDDEKVISVREGKKKYHRSISDKRDDEDEATDDEKSGNEKVTAVKERRKKDPSISEEEDDKNEATDEDYSEDEKLTAVKKRKKEDPIISEEEDDESEATDDRYSEDEKVTAVKKRKKEDPGISDEEYDENEATDEEYSEDEKVTAEEKRKKKDQRISEDIDNDDDKFEQPYRKKIDSAISKFLPTDELMNALRNRKDVLPSIPLGAKENISFMICNKDNVSKRSDGRKCVFFDDCGVWDTTKGKAAKTYFIDGEDGMKSVFYRGGKFVKEKKVNKRRIYEEINPHVLTF